MAGDPVLEDLTGRCEDEFGNGDRSLPDRLDHRDDVGCRYVTGSKRPQPGQQILFDVPPPLLDRVLRHAGKGDGHVAGCEFAESTRRRSFGTLDLLVASDVVTLLDLSAGCGRQPTCPSEAN